MLGLGGDQLTTPAVSKAWSVAKNAGDIVADIVGGLADSDPALIALFVSSSLSYDEIVGPIWQAFPNATVVGCSTAGSVTGDYYGQDGAVALAFNDREFAFSTCLLTDLTNYEMSAGTEAIESAYFSLLKKAEHNQDNFFAMVLVDGLSTREEQIAASAYAALDEVPIFGASSGDNLNFDTTPIFYNGNILLDSALVVLGASSRKLEVFKLEHFISKDEKMVVTSADPANRIVWTLNAEPAAEEYARLIGCPKSELNPEVFAANPLLVRVSGEHHVRAIQRATEDDALHFMCAIDEGIVLTAAEPEDMRRNLQRNMKALENKVGGIDTVLCFDCILRRLEAERLGVKSDMQQLVGDYQIVGFSTYGEQYQYLHLNYTLTGLAIGKAHV